MRRSCFVSGVIVAFLFFFVGFKARGIHYYVIAPIQSLFPIVGLHPTPSVISLLYTQTECPKDALAVAFFGQSNSANYVNKKYDFDIPSNLLQFDYKSGKCFEYKEPLLGTDGEGGNVITYAAVELAKESTRNIVVIPFGRGASSILDWSYGYLSHLLVLVMERVKDSGISPAIFIWHQGEADVPRDNVYPSSYFSNLPYFKSPEQYEFGNRVSQTDYKTALERIIRTTRSYFPDAHFGVTLVSRCSGRSRWSPIRDAQKDVTIANSNVFISADSDEVWGEDNRYDGCHFSLRGAREVSKQYLNSISPLVK